MLQQLGIAWTVWKMGVKRFGPVGATVLAVVAAVGFTVLRRYLHENYPEAEEALEAAA